MQAERLVAVAPAVAGAVVLLHDDRRHAELPHPRAQRDAALPATDDEAVGLGLVAEIRRLLLALFPPARAMFGRAVLGAQRPIEPARLLEPLELRHRRQQGPDLAVLQPDQAIAARDLRLELDPGGDDATLLGRNLAFGQLPMAGLGRVELMPQHILDLVLALHRLEVPGEGHEVAPIAVVQKHLPRRGDVAALERLSEIVQKTLRLVRDR